MDTDISCFSLIYFSFAAKSTGVDLPHLNAQFGEILSPNAPVQNFHTGTYQAFQDPLYVHVHARCITDVYNYIVCVHVLFCESILFLETLTK